MEKRPRGRPRTGSVNRLKDEIKSSVIESQTSLTISDSRDPEDEITAGLKRKHVHELVVLVMKTRTFHTWSRANYRRKGGGNWL